MKLKECRKRWLKRVLNRTDEERAELHHKDRMLAMSRRKHPRTYVGTMFIYRNNKCFCGSGVKFKNCCWSTYATLPEGTQTPAMLEYNKKVESYYKRHGRMPVKRVKRS